MSRRPFSLAGSVFRDTTLPLSTTVSRHLRPVFPRSLLMPFATADSYAPSCLSVPLGHRPSTLQVYIIKVRVFPLGSHAHPSCAHRHRAKQASRFLPFGLLLPFAFFSYLLSCAASYTPNGYCIPAVLVCSPVDCSMTCRTSPQGCACSRGALGDTTSLHSSFSIWVQVMSSIFILG